MTSFSESRTDQKMGRLCGIVWNKSITIRKSRPVRTLSLCLTWQQHFCPEFPIIIFVTYVKLKTNNFFFFWFCIFEKQRLFIGGRKWYSLPRGKAEKIKVSDHGV